MQVFHRLEDASSHISSSVVAIGNFDGCHLGHRSLIQAMVNFAKSKNRPAVVLTFYPHPVEVLKPGKPLQRLTTTSEKLALMETLGVDAVLVEKFDLDLAKQSPEEFFEHYLIKGLKAKGIYVGFNFHFGKDRAGNPEVLKKLCEKHKIEIDVAEPFEWDGVKVSSSTIRELIKDGDVVSAEQYLGRPYSVTGQVVTGDKRGADLGFPTANLKIPSEKTLPKTGVYVTRALWQKQDFRSVTNIGNRPTFHPNETHQTMEVHLIEFKQNLYDEFVELEFLERIRGEKKFDSVEALKMQIAKDVQTTIESKSLTQRMED